MKINPAKLAASLWMALPLALYSQTSMPPAGDESETAFYAENLIFLVGNELHETPVVPPSLTDFDRLSTGPSETRYRFCSEFISDEFPLPSLKETAGFESFDPKPGARKRAFLSDALAHQGAIFDHAPSISNANHPPASTAGLLEPSDEGSAPVTFEGMGDGRSNSVKPLPIAPYPLAFTDSLLVSSGARVDASASLLCLALLFCRRRT